MYSKTFIGKLVIIVTLNLNEKRPTNILLGRLIFKTWKTTSIFLIQRQHNVFEMEDNLNIFLNGRPYLFFMVDGQTLFALKATSLFPVGK